MAYEPHAALKKSLDAIDSFRKRILMTGWFVVAGTLGLYGRLAYLHETTDDLERLLGASVAALTALIAWAAFAIVVIITRTARSILRAVEVSSRGQG